MKAIRAWKKKGVEISFPPSCAVLAVISVGKHPKGRRRSRMENYCFLTKTGGERYGQTKETESGVKGRRKEVLLREYFGALRLC